MVQPCDHFEFEFLVVMEGQPFVLGKVRKKGKGELGGSASRIAPMETVGGVVRQIVPGIELFNRPAVGVPDH